MPVGGFKTFAECITNVKEDLKKRKPGISSQEAERQAGSICGRIEQDTIGDYIGSELETTYGSN